MANFKVFLIQLERERNRLTAQLSQIENALSALNVRGAGEKRRMSPAAIAKIRAAQKARWAKWRKTRKKD
jgi:50S ribosomal subunit-associated GTPase HflX